jgi:hypothetical protein
MQRPESKIKGTYVTNLKDVSYAMEFDGKGELLYSRDGELAVEATYQIVDDKIEFVDVRGPMAAPEDGKGIYYWKIAGRELSFAPIEDIGRGRKRVLSSRPWHAQE